MPEGGLPRRPAGKTSRRQAGGRHRRPQPRPPALLPKKARPCLRFDLRGLRYPI